MSLIKRSPSQPTATRPLAIQKDGTWFTYGYDLTKNICEVFGPAGYIRTAYSYTPFGSVSASENGVVQNFQWSSEFYDSELDLVYYNFRHYSPSLGRFLSRDPIAEQGGLNLYAFVKNSVVFSYDLRGLTCATCSKAVTSAWNKLEEYREALERLENKNQDGNMSPKKCKVNKPTCKKSDIKNCYGGEAFFTRCSDAPTHQLNVVGTITVLCGFPEEDFSNLESLIYHELYHAFQFCMGETDFKNTSCADLVKLEIDAYCAMLNKFPVVEIGSNHRNAILSRVKMSVEKHDACKEPGLIESFFEQFYNEDSCKTKHLPKK